MVLNQDAQSTYKLSEQPTLALPFLVEPQKASIPTYTTARRIQGSNEMHNDQCTPANASDGLAKLS
jgi:hypothetical protein